MKLYDIHWETQRPISFDVIDENYLCEGASQHTYLIRHKDGRKSVVAKDMYHKTREEAWRHYAIELEAAVKNQIEEVAKAAGTLADLYKRLQRCRNHV